MTLESDYAILKFKKFSSKRHIIRRKAPAVIGSTGLFLYLCEVKFDYLWKEK